MSTAATKSMSLGEGGSAIALVGLAFLALLVLAKAHTPEYALHAFFFLAGSVAAVFAIVSRYYDRPASLPPLELNGRPNYNFGPVKFATVAAMVWGIAGFAVGLLAALSSPSRC